MAGSLLLKLNALSASISHELTTQNGNGFLDKVGVWGVGFRSGLGLGFLSLAGEEQLPRKEGRKEGYQSNVLRSYV